MFAWISKSWTFKADPLNRDLWVYSLVSMILLALFFRLPPHNLVLALALGVILQFLPWRLFRRFLMLAMALGYLGFQSWLAAPQPQLTSPIADGYLNQLATSFKQGKLDVGPADPRFMSLNNPYDPGERSRNRISFPWDQSYFRGKYYLYWGMAPVLTVLLPFHLVTGQYLTEWATCLILASVSLLFFLLFVWSWFDQHWKLRLRPLEEWILTLSILLGSEMWVGVKRPAVYEIAILSGLAFTSISWWVLSNAKGKGWHWIAAGVFSGLAICSRPTAVFGLALYPAFLKSKKEFFYSGVGIAPILGLGALYNWLRFDSPFEFGFVYQLSLIDMHDWGFTLKNQLYSFGAYLFGSPQWIDVFPFLNLQVFGQDWLKARHLYMNEEILGLFTVSPMVILIFLLRTTEQHYLKRYSPILLLVAAGLVSMWINAMAGVGRRYSMEFFVVFIMAGSVSWVHYFRTAAPAYAKLMAMLLVWYGVNVGVFSSFSGPVPAIAHTHASIRSKLQTFYQWKWGSAERAQSWSTRTPQPRLEPKFVLPYYLARSRMNACVRPIPPKLFVGQNQSYYFKP